MKTFLLGIVISIWLLFSCDRADQSADSHGHTHHGHDHSDDHHEHDHDHDHSHDHHEHDHEDLDDGEVAMSDSQFERLGLELRTVSTGTFRQIIKTSGQLIAPTGQESVITARSSGLIHFTKTGLAPGVAVQNGQQIALVSARSLAEGDPFAKTKLEYETAEKEFNRAELLLRDSLISQRDYNQAKLAYETAAVAYQALSPGRTAADTAHRSGIPVSSTQSGYLKNILVDEGSYVTAGQAIAIVSSTRRLRLQADLPETYAASLPDIQSASFRTSAGNVHYDLADLNGRLISYARALQPSSAYLPVNFEFDNTGHLLAGSYVEVFLQGRQLEALTIPLEALIEEQGLFFVFTKERDGVYRKQPVRKGQDDGRTVRILEGIKPGDQVVTRGAYHLKLAGMSEAIPHGHVH